MKKLLKRWLAMTLAVLMVGGMLPTSAWAARVTDDAVQQQPVLDGKTDPVVDTLGRHDDDERPVDPVDPDGPVGDMSAAIDSVTLTKSEVTDFSGIIAVGKGTGQDPVAVLVVPNYATVSMGDAAADRYKTLSGGDFRGYFNNNASDASGQLRAFAGMPYMWLKSEGTTFGGYVSVDWSGQIRVGVDASGSGGSKVTTAQHLEGLSFDMDTLSGYVKGKTFYEPRTKTVIDPATTGLPFTVFIGGSSGFDYATMRIKVATQPLNVEIEPKLAEAPGMFEDAWEYATVKVTNASGNPINNVHLTLNRATYVTELPENWGGNRITADEGSAVLFDNGEEGEGNVCLHLYGLYGFMDAEDAVMGEINVGTLAAGESAEFTISLTEAAWLNLGFASAFNKETGDMWSEYTVKATGDGVDSDYADAGIHWKDGNTIIPKVRLVDTKYNPITVYDVNGENPHDVQVGIEHLTYDATNGYYTTNTRVNLGDLVGVDGKAMEIFIKSADIVDVPLYSLALSDKPNGAAQNNLGHYIWLEKEVGGVKSGARVKYDYYAPGTVVALYANDKAFSGWTGNVGGLAEGTLKDSLGDPVKEDTAVNYLLTMKKANESITANYDLAEIVFVTTFQGTNLEQIVGSNFSVEHVHTVEIKDSNDATVASATKDENTYNVTGGLTAQGGFNPWKITLAGGDYTLLVNGIEARSFSTNNLTWESDGHPEITGGTRYNYIIELGAVKPQIVGADHANSRLALPDDTKPGATDVDEEGYVYINKDTADPRVMYYPVGCELGPGLFSGGNDQPRNVSYAGTDRTPEVDVDDSTIWYIGDPFTVVSNAQAAGEDAAPDFRPLVAKFGQAKEFWVYVDGVTNTTTNFAGDIYLVPKGETATDANKVVVTRDATDLYKYRTAALDGTVNYDVYAQGYQIGFVGPAAAGTGETKLTATDGHYNIPMQTVNVADQSGITTTTASSFTGGKYTNAKSGFIPNGQSISLTHGTAAGYNNKGWKAADDAPGNAPADNGDSTYTAVAGTTGTAATAQTLTAQYDAAVGAAEITVTKDAVAYTDLTVKLSTSPTTLTDAVTLSDTTPTATGVYSNASISPGDYYIWVGSDCVDTNKLTVAAGATATRTVEYFTVTVNDTDASVSATSGDGVYLKGASATISATAATYYNPNPVDWHAEDGSAVPGTATVSGQVASAAITVNNTSEYTPSFTRLTTTVTYTDAKNLVKVTNSPFTVNQGTNHTVLAPVLDTATMDGTYYKATDGTLWRFNGWHDGTALRAAGYTISTITAPVTLTANWTEVYTVTYNAQGKGTDPASVQVVSGSSTSLPSGTGYTGTDYQFLGWSTSSTATAADAGKGPGASYTPTSSVMLYAVWSEQPGTAKILVKKDTGVYSGVKVTLYTGTTPTNYEGTSGADGKISIASVPAGTYNIYVGTTDTGVDVTVPKGDNSAEATVQYWTITVNKGTGAAGTTGGGVYLNNATVNIGAMAATYYDQTKCTWTEAAGSPALGGTKTNGSATLTATATGTYTAAFQKLTDAVTVTVTVDGTAAYPGQDVSITVNGETKRVESTTAGFQVTFTVDQQEAGYDVTVADAPNGWSTTKVFAPGGSSGRPTNANVEFHTLTLASGGNGFVAFASTAPTTTNGAPLSKVGLSGTVVNIAAGPASNYKFVNWTGGTTDNFGTNANTAVQTYTITKKEMLTANFSKEKFDTYLKVTVNGDEVTDANRYGSGKDVTGIKLVPAAATTDLGKTITYENDHWVVKGLSLDTEKNLRWEVTTVDGGKYYTSIEGDDKTANEILFGINIEGGAGGNDSTHTPTLKATTGTAAARIVTRRGVAATVALNKVHADYAFESYLAGNAAAPTAALGTQGTGSETSFTLAAGYSAPDDHADLYLKPVYTFSATVKTQYNNADTAPGGAVVLKSTEADKTLTGTGGSYSVSDLTPGVTYTVWVNGFESQTRVTAPGTATVKLVKLTGEANDDSNNTTGGGSVSLKIGADGPTGASVYVPTGATTADGKGLSLTATATPINGYRRRDKGAYSEDSATWTKKTEAKVAWSTTPVGTGASQGFTLTGLTADETKIVAHFVQRFDATVSVDPTKGGSATFTGKPANTGTAIGSPATTATVDKGDYVEATLVPSMGNSLHHWTFENGTLWTTSDQQENTGLSTGAQTTATTVYFFPSANGAKLVAHTEEATYKVAVKVNLDNEAYKGRKVELWKDGAKQYELKKGSSDPEGTYTGFALPGTYQIHVDGVTTGTLAPADETLSFSAAQAEGKNDDGTPLADADAIAAAKAHLTAEVDYYTVKLEAGTGGTVDFTNNAANAAKTSASQILLATAAPQAAVLNVGAKPSDGVSAHYRFNGWTVAPTVTGSAVANAAQAATTYTLPGKAALKASADIKQATPITITAAFVKQLKVTVQLADSGLNSSLTAQIKKTGDANWANGSYVLVDEGSSATVGKTADPTRYFFKDWTIQSGTGTFTNNDAKGGPGAVGYLAQDDFTPETDCVLELNMWQDALLTGGGWTYEKGAGSSSGLNVGKLSWTANSAQTPKSIVIKGRKDGATSITLTASNYTVDAGGVYTLDPDFLTGLDVDTYDVKFTYDLGTPVDHKNVYENQFKEAVFGISSTPYQLTEVNIQAEDKTSATVNPYVTARDAAIYKDHTAGAPDIDYSDLTFIWYYSDTKPTQKAYADQAAAVAAVPAGSTVINTGVTSWTDGANTVATGTAAVTAAMEGGYIFAVVHTPAGSETAAGAVITNAIPVDFDAKITVHEDDEAIAAAGNYSVYLWPADGGAFVQANAIGTVFKNGRFETENFALTGGKDYHVYAKTVEGGTAYQKVGSITISRTNDTATVKYYTVNVFATAKKDAQLGAGTLGETFFTSTPSTQFAVKGGVANNESVADGTAVLSGTTVTARANAVWTQDYKWNWGDAADNKTDGTNDAPASLTYGSQGQSSGNTGKDYAISETAWIGGQLEQRTYKITGDVKSVSGTGGIATATLTANGHSFVGTFDNSGVAPATVTFTGVPRTVADSVVGEHYTISATPSAGSTIMGYSAPQKTVTQWENDGSNPNEVTVSSTATAGRFTIFVAATVKTLTVADTDNAAHKAEASGTGSKDTTHTDTGIYWNYHPWADKTVTITNNGNTPLEVTLNISKGSSSIYSGTGDTDGTLNNGEITVTGLDQLTGGKVTLQPKEHKDFVIATVGTLNAYDDDTYSFVFSSTDAREGFTDQNGPTVTYKYATDVNPVTIKTVTAELQSEGFYKVTDFTIQDAKGKDQLTEGAKAANNAADPTSGDLIYTWYYADWNDNVTLSGGVPKYKDGPKAGQTLPLGQGTFEENGKKYTPTTNERGKALYLVLKGRDGSNATGAAMTPNVDEGEPVVLVPYQGIVQIKQDDVLMTESGDAADYTVELRRKNAPDGTPAITMTWNDDLDGFVTDIDSADGQLWARDPEDNTSAAWVYEVWASRVKGSTTLQNTNLTITVDDKDQVVDFYKVQIDPTTVNQGIYDGTLTPASGDGIFLTAAPTSQPTAATTVGNITVPDDGFVQKGNNVTFTYPNWVKDYKLTWGGATSGTAQPGANSTVTATYSAKVTTPVTTELSLKTYPVVANVKGPVGWVNYITMALTEGENTYTFTTKSGDGNILGIDDSNLPADTKRIAVGKSVTFQLPKADGYTTTANVPDQATSGVTTWNYSYEGTKTDPAISVNVTGTAARDTYDVVLQGEGLSMEVTETALPAGDTSGAAVKGGQASIPDGTSGIVNGEVTQIVHLNYHYDDGQTVTLSVHNPSSTRPIYNVARGTETVTPAGKITSSAFAGGDKADTTPETMTLTIGNKLPVGTYTYSTKFTFQNQDGGKTAEVTYSLTVVVDPLPFTAVTTKAGTTAGTHTVDKYTVEPTGETAIQDTTVSPAGADAATGLTHGTDYAYKWVRTATNVTLTNADVTWAAGTVTLPASAADCNGTSHNTPTYTPNPADQGQKLYLVVYAMNNTNATGAAISEPITTGYTGRIRVHVDGTQVTGAADPNPGYTVKFVPSDTTKDTMTGVWNSADGYTATLDPEVDSYSVQISRVRGDGTNLVTLSGVTITNAHRDDDAYYFTVTAKDYEPKDYLTGQTGETFADADKKFDMTIGSGDNLAALPSGTPVLSGQTVAAKAKGWAQDYKLTWQSDKVTGNVSVTTGAPNAADQQTSAVASADGAFSKSITETTFIGGRLDQNTYTVTGRIRNSDGKSGGVTSKVELTFQPAGGDTRNFTLTATGATGDHKFADDNADGTLGNAGDTVVFTVVKGAYAITATEGANTVISAVTLGVDDVVKPNEVNTSTTWADRNKETMTQAQAVTANGRVFNIVLEGRDLALKVADGHDGHEATSTTTNDKQRATHPAVYYFNGVDTAAIPLTLTNTGNAQLTVTGAVTKTAAMPTDGNFDVGSALAAGDKVTVSGLPTNGIVAVGGTLAGGSVSVAADAANRDDAVYIVKFTSTTTDTAGNTVTGPTVYYVFDLMVKPLPIKTVAAERLNDGKLQLKDYAAGTADSGLANIEVAYNDDGDTAAASGKDLHDSDFSYIWAKAKPGVTVDESKFDLTASGIAVKAGVADVEVLTGGTGYNTRQFTPGDADQGMNFYLIAYRSADTANASEFAVSPGVYAQVRVGIKAYRTGGTTEITDSVDGNAKVTGTLGADTQSSQDGFFTVTGTGTTVDFTANLADHTDPAKAKYYFMNWAADPTGGIAEDGDNRLAMTYSVTQKATVIGYYDLLPTLSGSTGYNIDATAHPTQADRTFTYAKNDGSGTVKVYIAPKGDNTFLDGTQTPIELTRLLLESAPATMGADGNYVLKDQWIKDNLGEGTYIITFFDTVEGATTDGSTPNAAGYAGYDRSIEYEIVAGEKTVIARVKNDGSDDAPVYHGEVQVTNSAADNNDGGRGTTSELATNGGSVTIKAYPDAGYVFEKWDKVEPAAGTFGNPGAAETTYKPKNLTETVEASFVPGTLKAENIKAVVIYGNDHFETGSQTQVTATSTAASSAFTYAVTGGTLPEWLQLNATTGEFTFVTGKKVNTNVESSTGVASYTAVDDEIVLTVTATETNTDSTTTATYTIDVRPGTLSVLHDTGLNDEDVGGTITSKSVERGNAYKALNLADPTAPVIPVDADGVPMYNETVLKQLFAYVNVHDQADTEIDTTGKAGDATDNDSGVYANGTWTVAPGRFQGTGEASVYQFTFTYKPDVAEEKWNYTAARTDMTLTIAKPPVGAQFADTIKNFTAVENILKPGAAADYTTVEKPDPFNVADGKAPEQMAFMETTFRKNESLTYLDTEPVYTVALKSLDAAIHGARFNVETLTGFALATGSAYPTFTDNKFASTDGDKFFDLVLAPVSGTVWVGEHHAKFTLTGYSNADLAQAAGEPDVKATYELIVKVEPKVITSLDVTVTDPGETPALPKVDGTVGDQPKTDLTRPDGKNNKPVAAVTDTWSPDDGPDGKFTQVEVTVKIDPNYIYVEDDPATDPDNEDITERTDLTVTDKLTPEPVVTRDGVDEKHIVHITQAIPYLMHDDVKDGDPADVTGPKVDDRRTVTVAQGAKELGSYTVNLGAYGADVYNVEWTIAADEKPLIGEDGIGAVLKDAAGNELTWTDAKGTIAVAGPKASFVLDLSEVDTTKPGTYSLTLTAEGKAKDGVEASGPILSTYVFQLTVRPAGSPTPPEVCPCKVLYYVGVHGVTEDATIEDVKEKERPSKVPGVAPLDGYVFRGWSLTNPATLKDGEKITLVDPKTVEAKGETMVFYAVIVERPFHGNYVIGYPNGNFGPADNINRASVATIIARAILPDFVEGANYGNPGNYGDVSGHWAESAIAYCSKFGVFKGYDDGNFYPDKPITRQEIALVIARLDGVMAPGEMDFTDIDQAGEWALGGIYTACVKGWFNGYTDGSFKPLNNIRRDEAVKVFNAYLGRGVDADGLSKLHEYVYPGSADSGTDAYMTWPDVPKDHWAYYEIVEAANDHEYVMDFESELGHSLPEEWDKCWIDRRWLYHEDLNNGGSTAALASAGFGVGLH